MNVDLIPDGVMYLLISSTDIIIICSLNFKYFSVYCAFSEIRRMLARFGKSLQCSTQVTYGTCVLTF